MEFCREGTLAYIFIIFKYIYLFSSIYVFISARTIYAVLALILSFIGGACLSIMVGATFVGFLLLVVYVGAVLVFFLFVTMMVNTGFSSNFTDRGLINLVFIFSSFIFIFIEVWFSYKYFLSSPVSFESFLVYYSNINLVGYIIYNYYWVPFIICGFVLLVAMIGAIALLVIKPVHLDVGFLSDPFEYSKRVQSISHQVEAKDYNSMRLASQTLYINTSTYC